MNAAIVFSGGGDATSPDNQDTQVQVEEIGTMLESLGIASARLPLGPSLGELETSLLDLRPDFIFNLVETAAGTDRLLYVAAACFEFLKIPYTGCPASALALLASKLRQKGLLRSAGLPTPDWIGIHTAERTAGPWIVKSDSEHASVGLGDENVVTTASQARGTMARKREMHGGDWFAEAFIDGREFNLSLLEGPDGRPQVLAPAEIRFGDFPATRPKIVGYEAKWAVESFEYQATTRHFDFSKGDDDLLDELGRLSLRCWHLFGLKGAARVDFRVDTHGNPWILEINANPCLSSDAGFMAAAQQSGLTPLAVIRRLLPGPSSAKLPLPTEKALAKATAAASGNTRANLGFSVPLGAGPTREPGAQLPHRRLRSN